MNKYRVNLPLIGNIDCEVKAESVASAKANAIYRFNSGQFGYLTVAEAVCVDNTGIDVEFLGVLEPKKLQPRWEVRRTATFLSGTVESMPVDDEEGLLAWEESMLAQDCNSLGWAVYENQEDFTQKWVSDADTRERAEFICAALGGRWK